jgi:hypothetical protein
MSWGQEDAVREWAVPSLWDAALDNMVRAFGLHPRAGRVVWLARGAERQHHRP